MKAALPQPRSLHGTCRRRPLPAGRGCEGRDGRRCEYRQVLRGVRGAGFPGRLPPLLAVTNFSRSHRTAVLLCPPRSPTPKEGSDLRSGRPGSFLPPGRGGLEGAGDPRGYPPLESRPGRATDAAGPGSPRRALLRAVLPPPSAPQWPHVRSPGGAGLSGGHGGAGPARPRRVVPAASGRP